jgi:hypothetical protein
VVTGKSLAIWALASASVLGLAAYFAGRPTPAGLVPVESAMTQTTFDQSRSATSLPAPKADRRRPAASSSPSGDPASSSSQVPSRVEPATSETTRPTPISNVDPAVPTAAASPANTTTSTAPVPAAGTDAPRPTEPRAVEAKPTDNRTADPKAIEPKTIEIKKDAVIGIHLDQTLTSDTARLDDRITARVARDVVVDGRTAIPAGARLEGAVTLVERNQATGRGKLGIRFATLVLGDNTRIAIQTDTIFRESDPIGEPSAAIGAGAALGAMLSKPGIRAQTIARGPAPSPGPYKQDARIPSGSSLTVKLTAALTLASNR